MIPALAVVNLARIEVVRKWDYRHFGAQCLLANPPYAILLRNPPCWRSGPQLPSRSSSTPSGFRRRRVPPKSPTGPPNRSSRPTPERNPPRRPPETHLARPAPAPPDTLPAPH